MSPLLPEAATLKSVVAALNAQAERIAALEESTSVNRDALRALFTLLHPEPDHQKPEPPTPDEELPPVDDDQMAHDQQRRIRLQWAEHGVLMHWLTRLGGRIPLS